MAQAIQAGSNFLALGSMPKDKFVYKLQDLENELDKHKAWRECVTLQKTPMEPIDA